MKVCLVGSSGGHLTHLYMLKPFWKDKERFWVTFDKEDARSLLEGEKVYPCYYPTNRSLKALVKNTKIAWDVLHKEKPDLIVSCGAAVAVPFFYIGKMMGAKVVYIEVFDRIDKYEVRKFIEERIGREHLIPCLGVWNHFDEIDFDKLPNQFVLKCTHDSGGLIICKDKSTLDLKQARKKIEHCLKRNYFLNHREWPYKDVKPRIIAEEYTVDESGYELKDYKIFCFDGKPKAMFIATDRGTDTKFDFFDTEFHHLPFTNGHPNADKEIKKPTNFDEMLRIAGILSKGMPEVRVDLYNVNGKILFGEMTFFHWSGLMPFEPEEWDYKFGSWIELPMRTSK